MSMKRNDSPVNTRILKMFMKENEQSSLVSFHEHFHDPSVMYPNIFA